MTRSLLLSSTLAAALVSAPTAVLAGGGGCSYNESGYGYHKSSGTMSSSKDQTAAAPSDATAELAALAAALKASRENQAAKKK